MKIEFSKNKEINEYISKAPKNQEIKINKDLSLQIKESYLETSYEYFDYGVESIDLICKRSNGNHATVNLSYWRQYEKNFGNGEFTHQVPESNTFIDEVISQILSKNKAFNISAELQKNINYQMERLEREEAKDEFVQKYMKLDPQNKGGFSEIYENGKKSYGIYFTDVSIEKYLTRAIDYLKTIESKEAHELIGEAQQYIEKYGVKEIQENTIDAKIENHLNKIVNSSNGNNQEMASSKPESQHGNSREERQTFLQNKFDELSKTLSLPNNLKTNSLYFSFDNLLNYTLEQSDNDKEELIAEIKTYKAASLEFLDLSKISFEERAKLTTNDINQKLTYELNYWNLKSVESRKEFYKYLSNFNSNNYSYRNKLLLHTQANNNLFLPVFGSFNEWKEQGTFIKAGQKGLIILIPSEKTVYYEKLENGDIKKLPATHNSKELARYDKMVKEGKAEKLAIQYFNLTPKIFSLSQTSMKEQDRIAYLQRYNATNTSEQNKIYFDRLVNLYEKLGIKYQEVDAPSQDESLGKIITFNGNSHLLQINSDLTIDAKITTGLHELGHYMLHHKQGLLPEQKNISTDSKEIQAQLFSHITAAGIGIDAEQSYSSNYLFNYLKSEAKSDGEELTDIDRNHLLAHLQVVEPAIKIVSQALTMESPTSEVINGIKNFQPYIISFNKQTNLASLQKPEAATKTIQKG